MLFGVFLVMAATGFGVLGFVGFVFVVGVIDLGFSTLIFGVIVGVDLLVVVLILDGGVDIGAESRDIVRRSRPSG